ncbi:MAG: energy-coupling factor transporter transmembrane protein EcfT [Caldilineaceae bacterium]|nr:energy-coupling factor transporter transmembrane protein EcfT [Caldilineaceae bacterium]
MEFELLRNVTIGQYIPTDSVVHRLDPRAKILAALLFGMALSVASQLLPQLILLTLLLLLTRLAGLKIRYVLRGLLPSMRALLFLFIIQLLFQGWREPSGQVFIEWHWLRITEHSLRMVGLGVLRVIEFFVLLSLLTLTTPATQLTHGLETLLSPLRRIGLPVHEIALMNMIALRFIPTLAEELEQIMKAQASRGGAIGQARWWRPDQMARERLPLIVPLFLTALRRSEELIVAMEARNYSSGIQRTRFAQLSWHTLDTLALLLMLSIYLLAWQLPWSALF